MTAKQEKAFKVTLDLDKDPARITVEPNMPPAAHYRWNINTAARMIVEHPSDNAVYLAVYRTHKDMLRRRGIPEEALEEGDKRLLKRVELGVKAKLNR